jgi:Glycosyl hydrolases family 16
MRRQGIAGGIALAVVGSLLGAGVFAAKPAVAMPARAPVAQGEADVLPRASGRLEFSATFYGSHVNTKTWSTCYPKMDTPAGCTNFDGQEVEWYLPSQVVIYDRVLHLVAKRMPTDGYADTGKPEVYACRSGMITTYKSFTFKYGFVQVVAKIPHAPGLWPALWLDPANGAVVPEIDMVESWGVDQRTAAYFHPAPLPPPGHRIVRGLIPRDWTTGWQTYSLSWTRSQLTYYVGGNVVLTVTKSVPHQAMYFLADLAEYVKTDPGNCHGQMLIRSVKVWAQ